MKNTYKQPEIKEIKIDYEISLILQSAPPGDPFGAPAGLPGGFDF